MEVCKVAATHPPRYPDKQAILADSALLLDTPERWRRNAAVCAALASVSALLLSSCSTMANNSESAAIPVPFFEYGDGRGGFGCVSVAPPAFLSESEAHAVIYEIAKEEGILFQRNQVQLEKIGIPVTHVMGDNDPTYKVKKGTLLLDGTDEENKVAFEFISTTDIEDWADDPKNMWSSVSSYDFIGAAKALSKSLGKADTDMAVAVFYDPSYPYNDETKKIITECKDDYPLMERKLRELAREDLKKQVLDFIAWLKAEGII